MVMKPVRLCFWGLCTSFTSIFIVLILLAIETVEIIYVVTVCDYNNKTKDWHRHEASNITYSIVVLSLMFALGLFQTSCYCRAKLARL